MSEPGNDLRAVGKSRETDGSAVRERDSLQKGAPPSSVKIERGAKVPFGGLGVGGSKQYLLAVRPVDIQQIGEELAVKWDDGSEGFVRLETLRRYCPCAGCKGEVDIMGNLYKGPDKPLTPAAFRLKGIQNVGGYGVQPVWGDGHGSGIFSYEYLKKVMETATA